MMKQLKYLEKRGAPALVLPVHVSTRQILTDDWFVSDTLKETVSYLGNWGIGEKKTLKSYLKLTDAFVKSARARYFFCEFLHSRLAPIGMIVAKLNIWENFHWASHRGALKGDDPNVFSLLEAFRKELARVHFDFKILISVSSDFESKISLLYLAVRQGKRWRAEGMAAKTGDKTGKRHFLIGLAIKEGNLRSVANLYAAVVISCLYVYFPISW